jgi:hypothetical protein
MNKFKTILKLIGGGVVLYSLFGVGLLVLSGVIFLFRSCDGEIRDFDITRYEKATVIGTLGNSKDKIKITTSSGVNATISFVSINSISIRFQDDKKERGSSHESVHGSRHG